MLTHVQSSTIHAPFWKAAMQPSQFSLIMSLNNNERKLTKVAAPKLTNPTFKLVYYSHLNLLPWKSVLGEKLFSYYLE